MADGLGSDFSFDFQCSPCTDEGLNNEATKLCTKCNMYFCGSCVKSHDRLFKGHTTLNKEEFQQSQHGDQQLTETCTKHGGKVIDMYCEDDDVVGCAVCISLNHRTCETIKYIPEMTIDQRNAKELDETMKQVSASCQKYLCMKDELRKKLEINSKEIIEILESVEQKRLQINTVLDEFQEELLSQVRNRNDNVEEIFKCATLECDNALKPLRVIENNLKKSKVMDQTRSFIALKVANQTLSERNVLDENIQAFGTPAPIPVKDMMQAVIRSIERKRLLLLAGPLTDVFEINASMEDQSKSICTLPNGHVICLDTKTKNVYQLDAFNNLQHSMKFSDVPSGLCIIAEDEVAVTISDERKVKFLKIKDGFEIARSFTIDRKCNGIMKLNDTLYIIHYDENTVGIYNLDGKLLSIIDHDESGNKLFSKPEFITCSSDQSKVYIVNDDLGINVFDSYGNHMRSFISQKGMFADKSSASSSAKSSASSSAKSSASSSAKSSASSSAESSASSSAESSSDESTENIPKTTDDRNTKENNAVEGDKKMVEVMSIQHTEKGLWYFLNVHCLALLMDVMTEYSVANLNNNDEEYNEGVDIDL